MKRSSLLLAFALILTALTTSAAHAGTMISGGLLPIVQETSFYGDEPVRYCVSNPQSFSLDRESARRLIRQSLDQWISEVRKSKEPIRRLQLPTGEVRAQSLNFVEGVCDARTELVFTLGAIDANVSADLQMNETFLLTETQGLDASSGRSHVEIWIAPDLASPVFFAPYLRGQPRLSPIWSDEVRFSNTITHEIGHLLGFGHDYNSVMSVDTLIKQVLPPRVSPARLP